MLAPEPREDEGRQATGIAWIDPDELPCRACRVVMLGATRTAGRQTDHRVQDQQGPEYFTTTVHEQPGEAYKLLPQLADLGLDLVAFTAVPVGPMRAQLTIFPEDARRRADAARKAKLVLDGPHAALLVQGNDELGALARIHGRSPRPTSTSTRPLESPTGGAASGTSST